MSDEYEAPDSKQWNAAREVWAMAGITVPEQPEENLHHYLADLQRVVVNFETAKSVSERDRLTRDLVKTERDIKKLIEAIKEGVPGSAIKDEMQALEDRRQELTNTLEHAPASLPRLHPKLGSYLPR